MRDAATHPATAAAPIAAAAALAGLPGRVLLHSGRDDDELGRWSFVAAEPIAVLEVDAHGAAWRGDPRAGTRWRVGDPFAAIEEFLAEHGCRLGVPFDPEAPEPRVVGYLGYELGAPARPAADAWPRAWLAAYDAVARFDRDRREPAILGPGRARLAARLAAGATTPGAPPRFAPLRADEDPALHRARVADIRERIAAGAVYQVNLARRLTAPLARAGDPLALYTALAAVAPAPYGALVEPAPGRAIVSGSPERFLAATSGGARVETRPIKGTLARGDGATAEALARSPKDAAEHLMIVDLERNDLGRIAELHSVSVDRLAYIVELPALYHEVSRISARPRADIGYAALLRATFPGGSITGAPKLAAMHAIAELEPVPRGPYCGALGYFGAGGAHDLAIAIRIGVLDDAARTLHIHVGGGIVTDSDPDAELAETVTKAAGWSRALASLA